MQVQNINNRKATVPGYGKVWYDEKAVANIFGLGNMIKKHRVTFDSKKENAFLVHKKDGIIKFKASPEGLYYCTPSNKFKDKIAKLNNKEFNHNITTERKYERIYHQANTKS